MATVNKLETPILRVSRPVSACQRCRTAKVRCDGKLPACTACERAGRSAECSSANDQFARGKERSYVSSLETRIERLEKQIAQAKARKSLMDVDALNIAAAHVLLPSGGKARRREASDVDSLVSDFGFLSVNATARHFHGFTREMSFARLVLSTSACEEMPKYASNVLPQRYALVPLIQHYLDNFHVLYPFLSATKLWGSIDAISQQDGRYASAMDHWTTRFVLAIALASLSRRRGDTQYQDAVRHATAALDHIETVVHPGSSSGIQALLLLVLYAMLDPNHFSSWYLIGLASRAMVDIGLHQDPPRELRLKDTELELRRRLYLSVYALDRSISMVYLRGFSFTDDSASVSAPNQRTESLSTSQLLAHSVGPALQLSRLRRIQSSAYQQLFQAGRPALEDTWELMSTSIQDMHRWYSELTDQIRKPIKNLFRGDVLFSSILILSPPGLVGKLNYYGKFLIFEYSFEYAGLMCSVNRDPDQLVLYTSHDVLRASFVARNFITLLMDDSARLFGDIMPREPPSSQGRSPPLPPALVTTITRGVGEMVNRAYECLNLLEKALEDLGSKTGNFSLLHEFKVESRQIRQSLPQASCLSWDESSSGQVYVNKNMSSGPGGINHEPVYW